MIAYPLERILPVGITLDVVGEQPLLLLAKATPEREFFEPGGAIVRAYERASTSQTFTWDVAANLLTDQDGAQWHITEEALVSPEGAKLARIAGHLAFWFGWYSYFPETEVFE